MCMIFFSDYSRIEKSSNCLPKAKRRSPKIIQQYTAIGGGSPITYWTYTQGDYLIKYMDETSPTPHKLYIGFRYVQPLLEAAINELEKDQVERVVAFSQYPQYSCTTSGSSFNAIARHYTSTTLRPLSSMVTITTPNRLDANSGPIWSFLDRWPVTESLVNTFATHIRDELAAIDDPVERQNTVLLFSAHSIPMSVVDRGDPYPQEVAATVHAVMRELNFDWPYRLVWQSKVGPASWLGPSTENALHGLAKLGYRHAILIPIAFTSDHIETLYEMDVEYCRDVAKKAGMVRVRRAAALNDNESFMKGLAQLVTKHLHSGQLCTRQFLLRCPMCTNSSCGATRRFLLSGKQRLDQWTSLNSSETIKTMLKV
ncbi:hypothetical protein AHF37_04490 [Paragonimus kellicotti]|nr:hypothetical protein AHF37_04490 [Paragonimus kellicotti]